MKRALDLPNLRQRFANASGTGGAPGPAAELDAGVGRADLPRGRARRRLWDETGFKRC